jgi:hypothetical protein
VKNIVCINGSPRTTDESTSRKICEQFVQRITQEANCTILDARKSVLSGNTQGDFEALAAADAVFVIFPLYYFCIPAVLERYLTDYAQYAAEKGIAKDQRIYAVVNCGFPEAGINREAERVIACFAKRIGAEYRFGLLLGGGGMLLADVPPAKDAQQKLDAAFETILSDLSAEVSAPASVEIEIRFPRRLYFLGGNWGWVSMARKNGLKRRDLTRAPYAPKAE